MTLVTVKMNNGEEVQQTDRCSDIHNFPHTKLILGHHFEQISD